MTLKTFYPKLLWNTLMKRCWYGAASFLLLFIAMPLTAMLSFKEADYYTGMSPHLRILKQTFVEFMGNGNIFVLLLVIGLALLGAWSGLAWLHSRKQMDLYGSLPVKREVLFGMECAASVLWFLASYIIHASLTLLVGAQKGILTFDAIKVVFVNIGIFLLGYLACYFCAAVAMMLTGRVLTGILGTLVFLGIAPVTILLLTALPDMFFVSCVTTANWPEDLASYLSPVVAWFRVAYDYVIFVGNVMTLRVPWLYTIVTFLWVGAGSVLSVILLKIRPSEGAEQSMVFAKTEGIIKACILYPMSIGGGLFFAALGYSDNEMRWLWFGILFVIFVVGIIIEIIYHHDRKRIFEHKLCTGIVTLVSIATILFFRYDVIGMDRWIPEEDEVEHAVMLSGNYGYSYFQYPDGSDTAEGYLRNNMDKVSNTAIYKYLPEGLELIQKYKAMLNGEVERDILEDLDNSSQITIVFQMKNGAVKERNYRLSLESLEALEKELFEDPLYKAAWLPLMYAEDDEYMVSHLYYLGEKVDCYQWTMKEKCEYINIYKEELKQMSYEQVYLELDSDGLYQLECEKVNGEWISGSYPLNKHFVKSLAYLAMLEEKYKEI